MTRHFVIAFLALSAIAVADSGALAQEPVRPPALAPGQEPVRPALIVEVTMTRSLNDKVISTTPYSLAVVQDIRSSLRIGGDVPVPSTTMTPKEDGKPAAAPITTYGYRQIGTLIDVTANAAPNGQYRISLTLEDSSIYPPEMAPSTTKTTGAPGFRSFKSTNSFLLRDGQKQDYLVGVDRVSGEVNRVSVKLTVQK